MSKNDLYLLDMFGMCCPDAEYLPAFKKAVIESGDIDPNTMSAHMRIFCPEYIPQKQLNLFAELIAVAYSMTGSVLLTARYPADQLNKMQWQEIVALFTAADSMNIGSLAGAQWSWEDTKLTIQLRANGKALLDSCVPAVCRTLKERFSTDVDIEIVAGECADSEDIFAQMEKIRGEVLSNIPAPASAETVELSQRVTDAKSIFGSAFKTKPIAMNTLNLDMGVVTVEGHVFAIEHKELPKRNAWIISFDMTDETSSVRVNRFLEKSKAQPILEAVKEGSVLRVQGKLVINQRDGEMVLNPYAIMPGIAEKVMDLSTDGKRVELHLHTNMSNTDALTNPKAAIKQAAAWGHKAIAITDHGCVQSFTEALHTIEDWKGGPKVAGTDEVIKILYGCEGYYINDVDDRVAIHGAQNMPLDGEYVAFDLETTGLYPRRDKIIEIGAVRMRNGEEIDRFQAFVNPGQRLERRTIDLTGITDDLLVDAPPITEVLPKFLEFVGDSVLVAHNADFDTSFIFHACKQLGIAYHLTSLDTLTLSQNVLPKQQKYTLDAVARYFRLEDFNHHRAGDDALICGKIYGNLIPLLRELGIEDIQSINEKMIPLRMKFRGDSVHMQHIILFAKNQMGLRNLYHLISDANLKYFRKKPRIFKSQLIQLREGIIVGSACENNEVFQSVLSDRCDEELRRLASFYDYLEVQPISNNRFMLFPKKEDEEPMAMDDEELRDLNRRIVALGDEIGKMVVATGDVHFLKPSDEIFRRILLATKGFDDCDRDNPLFFRTTDQMLEEFSYLGEEKAKEIVITNPNIVTDMCDYVRPVPHNLFAPSIENSVEDLTNLVYSKMHRLYGENPPEIIKKRVETEMNDIIGSHYDVIYMSAQKLVQNSLDNGYLVGSRGSVGSSLVAYMSGITEVNSLPPHYRCPNPDCKYSTFDIPEGINCGADLPDALCPKCGTPFEKDGFNIPFETFLGFGGAKVPDIDLNFSGEYQARAHAYCIEMFGKSHVFRAGTVGAIAEKTAFGYAKKYLQERGLVVGKAEEARLAAGCVGVRRTTGQHPGGLVVIPQENEIWDFCPVQHPADDPNSDQITTHFEYHSMEENLLKLDMLGHDDPTMIRMMEDLTGVDAKKIPLDDKDTMSIFTSSKVLGYEDDPILGPTGAVAVPEFNTRFTRQVLVDTQPTKFDFLVRISGYTHGTDVWLGNAKDLILSGTARVDQTIGCRDDIMLYLIECGIPELRAFKIMESVRKGKGLPEGAEQEMIDANVPQWYITSCKTCKYLFPKAHAAAYVMLAFRIAWFKVHHPLAFYAAYFYRRSQKGAFDVVLMARGHDAVKANIKAIESNEDATNKDEELLVTLEVAHEYYLRGFEFLPIDLYRSHATRFEIVDGKLLPPFISISGLGESAAWDLMNGREGREFMSIEEVAAACPKVSKTHIQMLKDAGAFKDLPDTNQVSLF